jgi:transaldolase
MQKYNTKIFLDSANPQDTIEAIKILGFLDGQTTNPSLFAKTQYEKLEESEIWDKYGQTLNAIRLLLPNGSISAEVYADNSTTVSQMLVQADRLLSYDKDLHIKLPISTNGIKALEGLVQKGIKVNMTLGFDQNQAYAVAQKSINTKPDQIYYSSFIGRLFDNNINGINNLINIKNMYSEINTPVSILACSFRNLDQFLACMALEVDIVTVSLDILKEWQKHNFVIPPLSSFHFTGQNLKNIKINELDTNRVNNPLSIAGINKFAQDWTSVIK